MPKDLMPKSLVDNYTNEIVPIQFVDIIPKPLFETGELHRITFTRNGKNYERFNYISRRGEAIIAKDVQPCCVCGGPTNRVDIFYESRFCSDNCIATYEKDLFGNKGE